jgi:hypothetical protein
MQGKKLAFPCIPLAESGLINGLRRIQVKNFSLEFDSRSRLWARRLNLPFFRPLTVGQINGSAEFKIARIPF